jgi:ABC-type long-subunit fatty acid transport system fused permease/ATPase subunit
MIELPHYFLTALFAALIILAPKTLRSALALPAVTQIANALGVARASVQSALES